MRVGETLELLGSNVEDDLREAARELGHELPKNRMEVLSDFIGGLSRLENERRAGRDGQGLTDWQRGFFAALDEIAYAYKSTVEPELELAEDAEVIRNRKGWARLLCALADGPKRPTDLARETGMDIAAVSRTLGVFRQSHLIEPAPHAIGDDARTKRARLTLLGERMVRKLEPEAPSRETEAVLRAAVALFAHLVTERRVRSPYLVELARGEMGDGASTRSAQAVVALLGQLAASRALVRDMDGVLVATEAAVQERIASELDQSIRDRTVPVLVQDIARRLDAPGRTSLFVRCGRLKDAWNLVLERQSNGTGLFADARTIDWPDLKIGAIPIPDRGPVALVYDSLTLLENDRREGPPAMRALVDRADRRFVMATPGTSPPDGFEVIPVEA
jgi:DNA-binding MarR family transcriptional regulator